MADVKISQLPPATTPLTGAELVPLVQSGTTKRVAGTDLMSSPIAGNLNFTGTGNRITGDFSNATVANRVMFQNSTVNANTVVGAIPNGTGNYSEYRVFNSSDPANSSELDISVSASSARIRSDITGTGAYLPLTFATGGSERVRIDTSGNVGIGTSSPSTYGKFAVKSTPITNFTGTSTSGIGVVGYSSAGDWNGITFAGDSGTLFGRIAAQYTASGSYLSFGTSNNYSSGITNQAVTIDPSGNVGIGTSSPRAVAGYTSVGVNGTTGGLVDLFTNGSRVATFGADSGLTAIGSISAAPLAFTTNNTERARITAGGEVYIAGTTDQGAYNLQVNGTGVWGAGAYVNGSDARLKENVQTLTDGLSVVTQLRPVTFQYKADYSKDTAVQPGFIAQELQQAMAGKDYVDGVVQAGPEYLNVAYQSLIPVLTKAIQELKAELDAVKVELQTLKGN